MKSKHNSLEQQADRLLGISPSRSKHNRKRKLKKQKPFFDYYIKESKALYAEYMRKLKEE